MRHCIDRAALLAGIAPDADFRIDQVLFERGIHDKSHARHLDRQAAKWL
jgi:hypothetical protein